MARPALIALIACALVLPPAAASADDLPTGGAAVPTQPAEPAMSGGGAATPEATNPPPAPAPSPASAPSAAAAPGARAAQAPTTAQPAAPGGKIGVAAPVEPAAAEREAAPAAPADDLPISGLQLAMFAALGALAITTVVALRRSAA